MDDIGHNGEELKSNRVIVVVVGLFHSLIHTHTLSIVQISILERIGGGGFIIIQTFDVWMRMIMMMVMTTTTFQYIYINTIVVLHFKA